MSIIAWRDFFCARAFMAIYLFMKSRSPAISNDSLQISNSIFLKSP